MPGIFRGIALSWALASRLCLPLRYAFIFNPAARLGRTAQRYVALQRFVEGMQLEAAFHRTEAPGHAAALAREAADRADVVVAVGGDGTVHEVAKGLVAHGGGVPLGVIPLGTGNDFAKMLGMPFGLEAVAALPHATPTAADYGVVAWDAFEGRGEGDGLFFNGLGLGFDAQVAAVAGRYKALPGVAGYLLGVFDTLARWRSPRARVVLDGHEHWDAPMLLAAIGNGTTAGGGFVLTPEASITDGRLDLCLIADASRRRVLRLLPSVLRGAHVRYPEVHLAALTEATFETDAPVAVHADGEVLTRATQAVRVRVVPGGLTVLRAAL